MNYKKLFSSGLALTTALVMLAACGSSGSSSTTAGSSGGGSTEAGSQSTAAASASESTGTAAQTSGDSSQETVSITLMQSKTEIQEDLQTVVDAYNALNTGVNVTLLGTSGDNFSTVLQSNFAADPASAPTIFTISGPGAAKFNDYMAPLDDTQASTLLADNMKALFTGADGKVNGLPMGVEGYGFIYNVDMFEQAGVDAASLTDIDKFVAALDTLSKVDGVTAPIGFAKENYFVFVHFFNWGTALDENYAADLTEVANGTKTLADIPAVQAWADALDQIAPYTNKGQVSYDEQVAGFSAGQYAMIHQGVWAQQVLDDNEVDFDYDFLMYPLEGNSKMPVGASTAYRVNNKASEAQQAGARQFLDWLITSEDGQNYSADLLNLIPPYEGIKAPTGKLTETVAKYAADGQTLDWTFNTDYPSGIDVDGAAAMQDYYNGKTDGAGLLQQLTEAWARASQ
ncbi:MAG: ABC transporter substrate-binding protein [Oscillospiraceae bacterium]|nr:ABC transporter substrate-binding protein [Oscillospiraceae bacterium]MDD4369086.1 ABC transporter substrate-binding protein [Oscillospiraceae bacterium]